MYDSNHTGTEWIEGFAMLAGALWIMGALFVGALVMLSSSRAVDSSVSAASNQTPVAESTQTQ